jgi:hypothetical protein
LPWCTASSMPSRPAWKIAIQVKSLAGVQPQSVAMLRQ